MRVSGAGEICAMFGVDCSSGDTFASDGLNVAMTSMFVPEPVISLSVEPADTKTSANFSKALQRFKREDPTFRTYQDPESRQTIIQGKKHCLGDQVCFICFLPLYPCCFVLHCFALYCTVLPCIALYCPVLPCIALCCPVLPCVALYCTVWYPLFMYHTPLYSLFSIATQQQPTGMGEFMNREYNCPVVTGVPRVAYRETIGKKSDFNYLHKKQSGGSGQYGRVVGYIEPLEKKEVELDENGDEIEDDEPQANFEFVNGIIGNAIPPEFINAVEKGFNDAMTKGSLIGHPVQSVRVVLTDGQAHVVDSSEMAFRIAARDAFKETVPMATPKILEPVMRVEVEAPEEFQGVIVGGLNRRKGIIQNTELKDEGTYVSVLYDVPLADMFGYSTELRSATQGKGEFTMEYSEHSPVPKDTQSDLIKEYKERSN